MMSSFLRLVLAKWLPRQINTFRGIKSTIELGAHKRYGVVYVWLKKSNICNRQIDLKGHTIRG